MLKEGKIIFSVYEISSGYCTLKITKLYYKGFLFLLLFLNGPIKGCSCSQVSNHDPSRRVTSPLN